MLSKRDKRRAYDTLHILEYIKRYGKTPKTLVFSLAKLIEFYKAGTPNDAPEIIEFIKEHTVREILANEELFGTDISYLTEEVEACV